ncbi:putative ATP-dependent RNA helicase DDX56-like isoform X2 [Dinothrombium tinctorium]|uniref:RNA helicase n=1 Tax=Dinothrombium tinctorium TaxID=1965070 RepID=A0A3S3P065_9ACAR|nr:putative ATP-dependent RNA helicase DDX56-like isoform X2 [Dinothrombium tinctorium]RWS09255.1 putative ATP-dependent RNA helicase DDX56-like isoform X2 [Dinothrombium tinctorium]RWS09288.1 putative ATP-dependent RNA helicase DDX56-like isoform X2 [Dinothrombium tinctorium]
MDDEKTFSFENFGLDFRVLKSIYALGWKEPTLIQEKAIVLAMEGKDVLMKGRTGCGKSAAFLIPIINKLLELKSSDSLQAIRAVILSPSKELCKQLFEHANALNACSSKWITIVNVAEGRPLKPLLIEKPDIIIGTPSALSKLAKDGTLGNVKETLNFLVMDEADLMFSFGYEEDIKTLISSIVPSSGCQSFLVSATLNTDIKDLKKLVLQSPVILKLEEPDLPDSDRLTQYHIQCEEEDKFVLINALFKLNLIRGRSIIFVNSVDRCYKLKLFLEQFGVKSCILNSELPATSRCFVVDQFNRGIYNILIASDEVCVNDPSTRKKSGSKRKRDNEFSVSRGIDFQNVSNVINFDFPTSVVAYIHRVGRTARGNYDAEGTALSFISIKEQKYFNEVKDALSDGSNFKPYQFRMEELEAFRYRSKDALRIVTSIAVREARIKEIKRELLSSEKLKSFFKEHPKDLKLLQHDKALHTVKHQPHLKHIPEYIVPPTLQTMVKGTTVTDWRDVMDEDEESEQPVVNTQKVIKKRKFNHKNKDPLKTFTIDNKRKRN